MLTVSKQFLAASFARVRGRLIVIYGILFVFNIGAWIWAIVAFRGASPLLGVAFLIYGLGLRHAVDADHIAAIDNVTRKLMQQNQRPVAVGFFFALGHSAIIVIGAASVAGAATLLGSVKHWQAVGEIVSTSVSALFLFAIAAMNVTILAAIYKAYRHVRRGGSYREEDLDLLLANRGFLARILRPLFRLVTRSWHMVALGFLFGLGFDTATEIAMFGIAAAQAAKGISLAAIIVFPVLFAAGMTLVDTTDGVMMLGAYEWAFVKPIRKLYYNMNITLISVLVAVLVGGIEALGLLSDQLGLTGGLWDLVGSLNDNFNNLGFLIIGVFAAAWSVSYVVYRVKRLDELDVAREPPHS